MRALVLGRFQPFHLGHLRMVEYAASKSDHVIVGIGSSNRSGTRDNPFTAAERREMIRRSVGASVKYSIELIPDFGDTSKWVGWIGDNIAFDVFMTNSPAEREIFIGAGFNVSPLPYFDRKLYSATEVRKAIVSGGDFRSLLPSGTSEVLERIGGAERLMRLERRG